jgi:hypothetical protein
LRKSFLALSRVLVLSGEDADSNQIRLQCMDCTRHLQHHIRTAILGRQFCDSRLDRERSSDVDIGFAASAPRHKESKLYSLADVCILLRLRENRGVDHRSRRDYQAVVRIYEDW